MTAFASVPPEVVSLENDHVALTVDESVYPLEAVYGAAYIFIDRCYVLVERPGDGKFRVRLLAKQAESDAESLRHLIGEFANELLTCAWRHQITQDNRAVIEAVTSQAIAGAMGPPSLDELQDFDFTSDAFEDPLGIAASWEEKYKKKEKDAASDAGEPSSFEEASTSEATEKQA